MTAQQRFDPDRVVGVARSVGEEVTAPTVGTLADFGELFLRWNARINLGGMQTPEELLDPHLKDAFAAVRFVSPTDRVIDVGSGGGLPAIPMALLRPGARFDLFEPTAKKVAFLRTVVRELGIGDRVLIHSSRVETPPPADLLAAFDVACSRATLAPTAWMPLGLRLVREGGSVLVFATSEAALAAQGPAEDFRYGSNRRLLVFRRPYVSRGT